MWCWGRTKNLLRPISFSPCDGEAPRVNWKQTLKFQGTMLASLSSRRTDPSMFTLLNKKSTNNLVLTVYAAKVIAVVYTSSACTLRTRIIFGRFLDWITPKGQTAQGWAMFGSLQLTQQSLHIQMLHLFFCYSTKHTTSTIIPYYKNCNIEFAVQIIWPEVYTASIICGGHREDPKTISRCEYNQFTKKTTRSSQSTHLV